MLKGLDLNDPVEDEAPAKKDVGIDTKKVDATKEDAKKYKGFAFVEGNTHYFVQSPNQYCKIIGPAGFLPRTD